MPPFAKWKAMQSKELAYVIRVLNGDGTVCRSESQYRYVIELVVIDKEFGEVFSRSMSRMLGVKYHKPRWDKKEKRWRVDYHSKASYTWYKKCEEQGLEGFKEYIEYNRETVRYYLKGLFDSEGNNNGNKQIFLCNSDIKLLRYVQYLLNKYFNIISTGPIYKGRLEPP